MGDYWRGKGERELGGCRGPGIQGERWVSENFSVQSEGKRVAMAIERL